MTFPDEAELERIRKRTAEEMFLAHVEMFPYLQAEAATAPRPLSQQFAWLRCASLGDEVAQVKANLLGCGCSSMEVPLFRCNRFGCVVAKSCASWTIGRTLPAVQAIVPDFHGRSCRECKEARLRTIAARAVLAFASTQVLELLEDCGVDQIGGLLVWPPQDRDEWARRFAVAGIRFNGLLSPCAEIDIALALAFDLSSLGALLVEPGRVEGVQAYTNGLVIDDPRAAFEMRRDATGRWSVPVEIELPTIGAPDPLPADRSLTIVCLDDSHPAAGLEALRRSLGVPHSRAVMFTQHLPADLPIEVDWEPVSLANVNAYNRFVLRDLYRYVDTSHVLVVQADGYVLDASKWDPAWLEYDYIGAPWTKNLRMAERSQVGNSGFCLRSRRFLKHTAGLATEGALKRHAQNWNARIYDDVFACLDAYEALTNAGMRFAPVEIAGRFSIERTIPGLPAFGETFGFHGRHLFKTQEACLA